MTSFTLDQLRAQVDDAEQTLIALRIIAEIAQGEMDKIKDQLRQAQSVRMTLSKQYVAAIDAQMKEQANA